MLPLEGPLGGQAADLLSAEFAAAGVATVENAKVLPLVEIGTAGADPEAVQSYARFSRGLGVRYLFVGTISATRGPLASYAHISMTIRLVDAQTGQTRWIAKYGNPMWSSAMSTQGDLQRGAHALVKEFVRAGGSKLLE